MGKVGVEAGEIILLELLFTAYKVKVETVVRAVLEIFFKVLVLFIIFDENSLALHVILRVRELIHPSPLLQKRKLVVLLFITAFYTDILAINLNEFLKSIKSCKICLSPLTVKLK